jgi:uncharacterized caspase-like protein
MSGGNSTNSPPRRSAGISISQDWPRAVFASIVVLMAAGFWFAARWIDRSTQNLDFAAISYLGWPIAIGSALAGYYGLKSSPRSIKVLLSALCGLAAAIGLAGFLVLSNCFICTVPGITPSRFLISNVFRDDPDHKIDTTQQPQELLLNWNFDPAEIYDPASLALIQTLFQAAWLVLIVGSMSSLGAWAAIISDRDAPPASVPVESQAGRRRWRTPVAVLAGAVAASLLVGTGLIGWRLLSPSVIPPPRKDLPEIARSAGKEQVAHNENVAHADRGIDLKLTEQFSAGRKWAVLIGVDEYLDPEFPKLRYCVNDAKLMAAQLSERCGYDPERILLMTDDQEKLYQRPLLINLEEQVRGWLSKCESEDTVLVFFAGHGMLDHGNGYLVPQDCRKKNAALTAWATDELRKLLHSCAATQKILILDCCHSGGNERSADDTAVGPSSQKLGESFARAKGLITLASCQTDETSKEWDAKHHGLFTYILAQGLAGAADFDHNGIVDSDEIYRYTVDHVPLTAQHELNTTRQTPVRLIGEDVVGVFALSHVSPTDAAHGK